MNNDTRGVSGLNATEIVGPLLEKPTQRGGRRGHKGNASLDPGSEKARARHRHTGSLTRWTYRVLETDKEETLFFFSYAPSLPKEKEDYKLGGQGDIIRTDSPLEKKKKQKAGNKRVGARH